MRRRRSFRSRLAITMATYTTFVILVVTVLVLVLAFFTITEHYIERGRMLNTLIQKNVAHAYRLPELVMERVTEQMVVSALLAAELVALAQEEADVSEEAVAASLKRVIRRSTELHGYPLVNEFWVTDETGRARYTTADFDFTFSPGTGITPQAEAFRSLLEPGAPPVVQPLQPRSADGEPFQYVGVSGVDRPRIVQVGVSGERVEEILRGFTVQSVIENFLTDREIARIAVLHPDGSVAATTDPELMVEGTASSFKVRALMEELLAPEAPDYVLDEFAGGVGVATHVEHLVGMGPCVLFIQYQTQRFWDLVWSAMRHIVWAGALLILVGFVISFWMAHRFARPLRLLSDTAQAFGRGNLERRIAVVQGDRELRRLGEAFNHMADSLQTYMQTLRREARERASLESEFRIAADLQRGLLPAAAPEVPGVEVAAYSVAAREVGGDFYDYVLMGGRRLGVVIGDATGHGLPAALLVSECWSVLRALAEDTGSAADLLFRTNNAVCQRVGDSGRFATMFFAILDPEAGVLRYSVAGHNPPMVLGADGTLKHRLGSREGFPLGVIRDCRFSESQLALDPGDTLVLYSDGITEAHAPDGTLYGCGRLQECLCEHVALPPREAARMVLRDVREHMGEREVMDDMTLVLVRFHGVTGTAP